MPRHANQTSFQKGNVRSPESIEKQRETLRQQYANGERLPPTCAWNAKRRRRQRRLACAGELDRVPIGTKRLCKCRGKIYVRIKVGIGRKGWMYEHRHVVEQRIGRKLKRKEHVHHKNEITTDNRDENLELMSAGDHNRHHTKGRPSWNKGKRMIEGWSKKFAACIRCDETEHPHASHGVCRSCHGKEYAKEYRARQKGKQE